MASSLKRLYDNIIKPFFVPATTRISIDVTDLHIQVGVTDIAITCLVTDREICADAIQLMRSNESILSLTADKNTTFQDLELGNRSGVTVNFSIIRNRPSYLILKISRSVVIPSEDSGPYWCRLSGHSSADGSILTEESTKQTLNITGIFNILDSFLIGNKNKQHTIN